MDIDGKSPPLMLNTPIVWSQIWQWIDGDPSSCFSEDIHRRYVQRVLHTYLLYIYEEMSIFIEYIYKDSALSFSQRSKI